MASSPFSALASVASGALHSIYGQQATVIPRQTSPQKGVNAPREADPSRPVFTASVIRAESHARFNSEDNQVGRSSGSMRLSPISTRRLVTFMPGVEPRRGDLIVFDDRPGKTYELGETMPGTVPGITFAFAEKA